MKRSGALAVGIALAAFVMIEIYNAASGALLVIWLINRENMKEEGFEPQRIMIELEIIRHGDKEASATKPEERLAIGAALLIDGEVLNNLPKRPTRGAGVAAAIVPFTEGQARYVVYLPANLKKGDELFLHLYQLTPTSVATCTVRWSVTHPLRDKGKPYSGPAITLSDKAPAQVLDLNTINPSKWNPKWMPAE